MGKQEFDVNLEEIQDVFKEHRNVKIRRVFLNLYALTTFTAVGTILTSKNTIF
ncbi:MAG: hypothetical protein PWQ49_1087 [Methanohalophilus sp.]|nr:hypothetical protein [Methanohalophilus sp.]